MAKRDAIAACLRGVETAEVEIAFNELQESPRYPGGLALRFARVKHCRPDKRFEDADTIETVRALHGAQLARSSG